MDNMYYMYHESSFKFFGPDEPKRCLTDLNDLKDARLLAFARHIQS
jgi:hypothetical protein